MDSIATRARIRAYVRDNYADLTGEGKDLNRLTLRICDRLGIELNEFRRAYRGGIHELIEDIWPVAHSIAQIEGKSAITLGKPSSAEGALDLVKSGETWHMNGPTLATVIGPQPSDWRFR